MGCGMSFTPLDGSNVEHISVLPATSPEQTRMASLASASMLECLIEMMRDITLEGLDEPLQVILDLPLSLQTSQPGTVDEGA